MTEASESAPSRGGLFDKFIDGFVNVFGSKQHFALATFGMAFVVYMIFHQGYNAWLLSTGLASNNYESAIEYFLAVATLYQAGKITIQQNLAARKQQQTLDLIQNETDQIDKLLVQNTRMTQQIHDLLDKEK